MMKNTITKTLALAAAVFGLQAFTNTAMAETDENGLTPKHWYKFNGNLNSSGATALTISGEKGDSYVDAVDGQAYLFKKVGSTSYHPYGTGMDRGSGDFTVVTCAKTADLNHGIVWSQGEKTTSRGFALVAVGADKVALRTFGSSWGSERDIITATVSDATTAYHVYTVVYTDGNKTFTLYVDDNATAAGTGTVSDSASTSFTNKSWQFGNLYGGIIDTGMVTGIGISIDDYRLYQQVLTTAQIVKIYQDTFKVTKEKAYLWLDASESSTITLDGGKVTRWTTRSNSEKYAESYTESKGYITQGPTVSTGALASKNVLDFGNCGSGRDLQFTQTSNIRAVFMVADIDDSSNAFILGDKDQYHFHRGSGSSNVPFFSSNASDYLENGVIRRNQQVKTKDNAIGTGYGLITLIPTGGVQANRICYDRNVNERRDGGKRVAELIILTTPITTAQRDEIEQYLMDKWFPKPTSHAATISTSAQNFSALDWKPAPAEADYAAGHDWSITNTANAATVTIDKNLVADKLTMSSDANNTLTLAQGQGFTANIASYAFSNAGTLMLWKLGDSITISTFSGTSAATVGFAIGEGQTMDISGYSTDADQKYGLLVTSGTLNFTETDHNGTTTFNGRMVTADGDGAIVRMQNGDATGYHNPGAMLTAKNGGKLLYIKRDTLKTPVTLADGTLELASGCAGSSERGLDLYGNMSGSTTVNNAWTISGNSAIVVNGDTAADHNILLRDKNWDITVAENGTFTVGATLVTTLPSQSASGTRGKLVKKGSGAMTLNAASTYDTGTEVQAGKLTAAVSGALGTGAVTVSSGATLEAGAGYLSNALTLNSGATLNITGTAGQASYVITSGTFDNNGTVQLNGVNLPTEEYKVDGNRIVENTAPAEGDIHATVSSAVNWSTIEWYNSSSKKIGAITDFSQVNSAALTVEGAGTVTIDNFTTLTSVASKLTVTGAGTIVYPGTLPGNEKSSYQAAAWTGTVWLKNISWAPFDFETLGNTGSKVMLTGVSGYATNSAKTCNTEIVLADEGETKALTITDGYSGGSYAYTIAKLSGSGTWKSATVAAQNYVVTDWSAFTGSFDLTTGTVIVFGTTYVVTGKGSGGVVHIESGKTATIASGATWASSGAGLVVNGTLTNNGTITLTSNAKVKGSGTIAYVGKLPGDEKSSFTANTWTGTVWLKSYQLEGANLNDYGNASSKVRLTGVNGYLNVDNPETTVPIELVNGEGDVRALDVTDGSASKTYQLDKITGNGSINVSSYHSNAFVVQIKDVTEHTGKITSVASATTWSTATTGFPIYIGTGTPTQGTSSKITVAAGTQINSGCGWEAAAVEFGSTLTVKGNVNDVIVSGVTTTPTLNTAVTLLDPSTGTQVEGSYKLEYDSAAKTVKVVSFENPYKEWFSNNPAVLTFAGTGSSSATAGNFHLGPFNPFNIDTAAPTGQSFPGTTKTSDFPGWVGTEITPWQVFASNKSEYKAPGYVLRFASDTGTAGGMDADFNPMDVGGMIVETGATGWYFNSNKQNSARPLNLGDKRTTGAVATWFVFNEDFTFSRYSYGNYQEQTILSLCGEINFEIAEGKTVSLNTDTSKGCPNPVLDTTTSAQLKMHGAGTLAANLNATGDVTLDYTDLPYNRETAYIEGTLTINDATVIKLPADLPKDTAFKMATTVSGGTDGNRVIWLGETQVTKNVTFANGTISWAAPIGTAVAKINETSEEYATLTEALAAVENGQTITLLAACNDALTTAKTFTFVPAGYTYGGAVTVNQGGVLTIDGGDACTMAGTVTLNNGGKLITKGTLSLSSGSNVANNGSAIEVSTGTLTFECGQQKLDADITIQSGAKFVQGATTRQDDQFQYANAHTIDIYGTLDLGASRWSVKNLTTINLYPGALIEGVGQSPHGAIDAADVTATINVKKNGGTGGTATITATLRPRGDPGFAYNVEEGMTLELNGTLGNKANGFRKDGAGTLLISAAYATTGTITLNAGIVKLGNAGALGTSPIAFNGGTLDLNGYTLTSNPLSGTGNGTITNTSDTTASFNGISVAKGQSISIVNGFIPKTVGAGTTFTITAVTKDMFKFSGAGTVIYDSSDTVPTLRVGCWAEDWTGTFKITGFNGTVSDWDVSTYYNGTKSKFEFAGTVTGGYFKQQLMTLGELILAGDIKITNGYTKTPYGEARIYYTFSKLSGAGTLSCDLVADAVPVYRFIDVSAFTGTINLEQNQGKSGSIRVVLGSGTGAGAADYSDSVPAVKAITLSGEVALNALTLKAVGGIKVLDDAVVTVLEGKTPTCATGNMTVSDGASFVFGNRASRLNASAGITVASGVNVPVAVADSTGLAVDDTLMTWTSAPEGTFSMVVGSGAAKGTSGFTVAKDSSALKVAADATKTYYEVGSAAASRPTLAIDQQWLTDAQITGSSEAVQTALDTPNQYGMKPSDAYMLGYSAADAKTAAMVIKPLHTDLDGKIRLWLTGMPAEHEARAGVSYTVKTSFDPFMNEATLTDIGKNTVADMDLPTSGALYYQVIANIDPTGKEEEKTPTTVPSVSVVTPGMPLLTTPGVQTSAGLGTITLAEDAPGLTVKLAGAGLYAGQPYHIEVTEGGTDATYGIAASLKADNTVTFDFGKTVAAGTTCKLTMMGCEQNGNIAVVSPTVTGVSGITSNIIVSARIGVCPYDAGIATMAAPKMPQQVRIPAIATDGQGEVIACYDCRYGKSDLGATWDSGNGDGSVYSGIDIAENYSSDAGVTFDKMHLGVDVANMRDQNGDWIGGYANRGNGNYLDKERDLGDVALLYDPNGDGGKGLYWMMGLTGGGLVSAGTDAAKNDVVLYTRAKGKDSKWGNRRSVKQQILTSLGKTSGTINKGFLEGPGHGIVTTKACTIKGANVPAGTLVFPIQCFFSGGTHSGAAYSTDGGQTWKATALTDTNSDPQENCIMELDDGTWYMCTKCETAGYYRTYRYNHATDEWVKVEDGAPCKTAKEGSCLRMGVGSDGKGRYAICHARSVRSNIVVYFGVDMTTPGETPSTTNKGIQWDWNNYVTIHAEDTNGGYSSMCMVDDTTLGILYESKYGAAMDGGTDPECRMYFTRIDVSDKVVPPTPAK